LIRDVTK